MGRRVRFLSLAHRSMSWALHRRAQRIVDRLLPHLPTAGRVLDIGCGTGHNSQLLRHLTPLQCVELDVVPMKRLGAGLILFDGEQIPLQSQSADCSLLIYVLHYVADPIAFLSEIRRVTRRRLLLIQSVFEGPLAWRLLRMREYLTGATSFKIARRVRYIPPGRNPLNPRCWLTDAEIRRLMKESGWQIDTCQDAFLPGIRLSRSLYSLSPE